ncbi:tyrosine-protein phosphatase [Mycolicibacterium madagascariense]|uniref:tyrosine-protein phosphatase n=1 Tax=Mycolicibacterium madagascariense TaxID=212765 RepID=UPI0013D01F65|nr:tyrosine-protein phosphatase [Mycolicibacterium madagascariense]MCV7014022.1 tyrosine-protein phosphatase [Mycolicibacterium madagascariense]
MSSGTGVSTGNELSGAWNFRDVAEQTGIRPGRLFRSSELSRLDDAGRAALATLGVGDVVDLRSEREVERRGSGRVPDGVSVHQLPFHELAVGDGTDAPHDTAFQKMLTAETDDAAEAEAAAAAGRFMNQEYDQFPRLPGAHIAVRQVISLLADERPVIAHCFAGKDRTGFTVALVLDAIGVGREQIMADFLRSNAAAPQLRERILESVRTRAAESATPEIVTFAEARLTDEVIGVREEYLDTAWRAIEADYGSTANYLAALGVNDEQVMRLRTSLLA